MQNNQRLVIWLILWIVDFRIYHIDGLVQERHNSSVLVMELCLSCTKPSIYSILAQAWGQTTFIKYKYLCLLNIMVYRTEHYNWPRFKAIARFIRHWNGNVILIKFSILAALEAVIFDNIQCTQWQKFHQNYISVLLTHLQKHKSRECFLSFFFFSGCDVPKVCVLAMMIYITYMYISFLYLSVTDYVENFKTSSEKS